ncbi:MAG TPA: cadherin-like beta sandwich domain-containing protein [Polyangiales bacterium]|nr:cadherin-like beta sandwich domain-containing protein [Polyangiales bacterium]
MTAACSLPRDDHWTVSVLIDADSEVRSEVAEVEARVETRLGENGAWDLLRAASFEAPDPRAWPLSWRLTPRNNDSEKLLYQLVATAKDVRGAVIAQARVRMTAEQARQGLRVLFERMCLRRDTLCGAGQTCSGGNCVDATYDPKAPRSTSAQRQERAAGSGSDMREPPPAVAKAGAACDTEGERACDGFASRTPLRCEGSLWVAQAPCAPNSRCDSSDGSERGQCRATAPECGGRMPEVAFCDEQIMRVCTRDLLSSEIRPCSEHERCAANATEGARCECEPSFVLEQDVCMPARSCADHNGGCDPLTRCELAGGTPSCGACPAGYEGDGKRGCAPLLAALEVAAGELAPGFAPSIASYRLRVPLLTQRLKVSARGPAGTKLLFNAAAADSGEWESPVLALGENSIEIMVAAQSGASKTYKLIVERAGGQQALVKGPHPRAGDAFSYTLAISGSTLLVAAPREGSAARGVNGDSADTTANDSGAAFIFVRRNGSWQQQAYLKPDDTTASSFFGAAGAISGDTVAIGAFEYDFTQRNVPTRPGSVYVFVRSGETWRQQQHLTPSDGAPADLFGYAVALDGDTLVVGANYEGSIGARSGAAYVFTRSAGRWTEQQKLKAREPHADSQFGALAVLDGNTLAVAAVEDSSVARRGGLVHVFEQSGGRWTARQVLQPTVVTDGALFGYSMALQGDRLIVGAPRVVLDNWPDTTNGNVYVYERSGSEFQQTHVLEAPVPAASDYFGSGVAIAGTTLAIGSNGQSSNGKRAGAAYLFALKDGEWELSTTLTASNAQAEDAFGTTLAMTDELLAIGTIYEDGSAGGVNPDRDDNQAKDSGAVYLFY